MATVTEYTYKMTEGSDVYIRRPMILSDKTFFLETMEDFPYEVSGIDRARAFDKFMYMWVTSFQDFELPVQPITEKTMTSITSKNGVPFAMSKVTYDYNCEGQDKLFERDAVVAFHPSQRGKGLYRKYLDIGHAWLYGIIGVEYSTYETYDHVIQVKKIQKEKNWEYLETREAGDQNRKHVFKNTKEQYSTPSQYTFELTKETYDLTNERYATPAIQTLYTSWDADLT